mmetsp:Transcript_110440/g.235922  ORF Transcript_110440/g.235922 Transcript_110440/m.235922 type:complete len:265 (-) Transcript_110440:972-1766(-)
MHENKRTTQTNHRARNPRRKNPHCRGAGLLRQGKPSLHAPPVPPKGEFGFGCRPHTPCCKRSTPPTRPPRNPSGKWWRHKAFVRAWVGKAFREDRVARAGSSCLPSNRALRLAKCTSGCKEGKTSRKPRNPGSLYGSYCCCRPSSRRLPGALPKHHWLPLPRQPCDPGKSAHPPLPAPQMLPAPATSHRGLCRCQKDRRGAGSAPRPLGSGAASPPRPAPTAVLGSACRPRGPAAAPLLPGRAALGVGPAWSQAPLGGGGNRWR